MACRIASLRSTTTTKSLPTRKSFCLFVGKPGSARISIHTARAPSLVGARTAIPLFTSTLPISIRETPRHITSDVCTLRSSNGISSVTEGIAVHANRGGETSNTIRYTIAGCSKRISLRLTKHRLQRGDSGLTITNVASPHPQTTPHTSKIVYSALVLVYTSILKLIQLTSSDLLSSGGISALRPRAVERPIPFRVGSPLERPRRVTSPRYRPTSAFRWFSSPPDRLLVAKINIIADEIQDDGSWRRRAVFERLLRLIFEDTIQTLRAEVSIDEVGLSGVISRAEAYWTRSVSELYNILDDDGRNERPIWPAHKRSIILTCVGRIREKKSRIFRLSLWVIRTSGCFVLGIVALLTHYLAYYYEPGSEFEKQHARVQHDRSNEYQSRETTMFPDENKRWT